VYYPKISELKIKKNIKTVTISSLSLLEFGAEIGFKKVI
jgi:hypothetical protein